MFPDQHVLHADFLQGRFQIADQPPNTHAGCLHVGFILPQGGRDRLGGTGSAPPVHQKGQKLLTLLPCENHRDSLPENFKMSEALDTQPVLDGGHQRRRQVRQGFPNILRGHGL